MDARSEQTEPDRTKQVWFGLRRIASVVTTARPEMTEPIALTAMVSYLLAAVFGIDVPGSVVLQPVLGFVLLAVLPGYLLVTSIVGDRPVGRIVLYSVGLSLPVVVCLSIAVNAVLPVFDIASPLSPRILVVAVSALVLGLSGVRAVGLAPAPSLQQVASIRRSRPARNGPVLRSLWRQTPLSSGDWMAFVSLALLLVCTVLVTVLTDTRGFEGVLIVLLCAFSVVPVLLSVWRGSPALYPYAIWAVSAAVLLQMTLVSSHLWGYDIHFQYRTAAEIAQNGYWNPRTQNASTSLVTVTLLAAIYSMVTGIDLVLVYKLFYPLFVSLLPVGIWYVTRDEFGGSIATLSPFALVFYYGFFKDMPDKQLVAGLFAVLVLVAFLDRGLSSLQRWVLGLAFAVGLVFSHYGVSLLFVAFLGFALVARHAVRFALGIEVAGRISRMPLVGFLSAFWVFWYLFTASGVNFYRVVGVGYEMLGSLPFPTSERSGAAYATMGFESGYWLVYKFIYIALLGFVGLGILRALYVLYTDRAESAEYVLLSVGVFCFLVTSVVFTFGMGFDRTLQIALFVLSPFAIGGAIALVSVASWLAARLPPSGLRARVDAVPIRGLFAVFLAVMFLFSSGTVFALGGQPLPPYNINLDEEAGWPVYTQSEVEATRWLDTHVSDNATVAVYNDWEHIKSRDGLLVSEVVPTSEIEPIWLSRTHLNESAYVYVSHKPMHKLGSDTEYITVRETPFYEETLSRAETVYENEDVRIYYVPENLTSRE